LVRRFFEVKDISDWTTEEKRKKVKKEMKQKEDSNSKGTYFRRQKFLK